MYNIFYSSVPAGTKVYSKCGKYMYILCSDKKWNDKLVHARTNCPVEGTLHEREDWCADTLYSKEEWPCNDDVLDAGILTTKFEQLLQEMYDMGSYTAALLHGLAQLTEWYDPSYAKEWDINWDDVASDYRTLVSSIKELIKNKATSFYK